MSLFRIEQPSRSLFGTMAANTGEVNLREEFHDLMYGTISMPQRGHWIVYRRYDITRKSANYNEVFAEGVGGDAYPYTDEVTITRRVPIGPSTDLTQEKPGLLRLGLFVYYFEHTVNPKVSDLIFEIEWNSHQLRPILSQIATPYAERYAILNTHPFRSDAGRVEYYGAWVQRDMTRI